MYHYTTTAAVARSPTAAISAAAAVTTAGTWYLLKFLVNHYRYNITRDCGLHASVLKKSKCPPKKLGNNFPGRLLHT